MIDQPTIRRALAAARRRDPGQDRYIEALSALFAAAEPGLRAHPALTAALLERLTEPEGTAVFPIAWRDSRGRERQDRGFLIRASTALGPCRYVLCLRRGLDLGQAKALALETALQHALAGLPLGGGLAGADADPSAMTDADSRRFCRQFMEELYPLLGRAYHPAGWAGQVPDRELRHLTAAFTRLAALSPGGIPPAPEPGPLRSDQAAGHGLVYLAQCALRRQLDMRLESQSVLIAGLDGAGPWAGERAARLGARVTAIGDGGGYLRAPEGMDLALLRSMAAQPGLPLLLWALRSPGVEYRPGPGLWDEAADAVFLCGGPVDQAQALRLAAHRPLAVFASAPGTLRPASEAAFAAVDTLLIPAVAAGAGGAILSARLRPDSTRWDAERLLRAEMQALWRSVRAQMGPETAVPAAVRSAALLPLAGALLEQELY